MRSSQSPASQRSSTRRRRSTSVLLLSALLALAGLTGSQAASAGDDLSGASFANPGQDLRPGFTWWWPGAAVEDAELRAEVAEMAGAGFANAELFETPRMGLPPEGNPPETYMWGTPHWAARVRTALEAARDHDFVLDLQVSSGWPWTSPAVAGENADLSVQELAFGEQSLEGPSTFVGPPPPPQARDEEDSTLVAVTAAKRAEGEGQLDPDSAIDLTSTLDAQGRVHWEVPEGDWVLFGFWHGPTRSSGGREGCCLDLFPNGFGYVLDFLNRDSTEAAVDFLDDNLFASLGDLPSQSAGVVHQDSLEGIGARLFWTGAFIDEFQERRGYDLTPYLPALAVPVDNMGPRASAYGFPGSADERVRRDYAETLTELWVENHVRPVSDWAQGHGIEYAGRAIGADIIGFDVLEVAKAYDRPEIDHITNSSIDWVRTTSSAARINGDDVTASEVGDLGGQEYTMTLKTLKRIGDRQLTGGATQLNVVGYPYKHAHGADWPSWWPWSSDYPPFGPAIVSVSEGWTPEIPVWKHLPRLADYFARAQTVLRAGKPVTDVAIYRDAYGFTPDLSGAVTGDAIEPAVNSALTRAGFNYDIVNPETISDSDTAVENGRLVVQRPGYKALVIDLAASERQGEVDNSDAMAPGTADRLRSFAQAGLPIVFIGQFPERGVSYRNPGNEDAAVQAAVADLAASPNVRLAATEADLPAALEELGVRPAFSPQGLEQSDEPCGYGAQCVYSIHRRTADGDYWYIWNAGQGGAARFTGSFATPRGTPKVWDMWSGQRRRIGQYRRAGGRIEVPLKLAALEAVVIGFENPGEQRHVVSTDAQEVIVDNGELLLRSTRGGAAEATLSDGTQRSVNFGQLPDRLEPATWDLHVEGAVRDGEETHDLELTTLQDWRKIPQLKHTSGTGTYSTTVALSDDWTRARRGAYLALGRVAGGGAQVRVNGQLVHPAAVPARRIDVGPFLQEGENTIEVEVTTNLKNRLVEMATRLPGYVRFQINDSTVPNGLIGPVRLIPYAQRAVD